MSLFVSCELFVVSTFNLSYPFVMNYEKILKKTLLCVHRDRAHCDSCHIPEGSMAVS